MIVTMAPCVGGSRAGPGKGSRTQNGRTCVEGLRVMALLVEEYRNRGGVGDEQAPFGWIGETVPPWCEELQPRCAPTARGEGISVGLSSDR